MKNQLNRRDFIKLVGAAGGSLVLAVYLDGCAPSTPISATATPVPPTSTPRPPFDWSPNIYLKVDNKGIVTVTAFRSEMGQGIRTALAMLVAEELDADWNSIQIEQAKADAKYGDQLTGGSVSISTYSSGMRAAGSVARKMLVQAAADVWDVDPSQCKTAAGFVIHPDGQQKMPYGDLVEQASKLDVAKPELKDASQFKIVGTGKGHWDAPQMVNGKAIYGIDVRPPGMFFAAIARCPVFGGMLVSYDDSAAKVIPGVKQVISLEDRIAVIAENSWAAIQGRNALKINWDGGKNLELSSQGFIESAIKYLTRGKLKPNTLEAIYEMPYEAHATMEPMNCTASVHDGMCEVWAPTQSPQDVQRAVANIAKLPNDKVTVHVPLIGGGFGRRLQTDYAEEAVRVSMAIDAPVQVVWTRDDDLQHDFYQPMSVQAFRHPLDQKGVQGPRATGGFVVPTGAWCSVENFPQAYGLQCFIDELALALQRDPLDLRLELYETNDRALGVIKLATEKAEWSKPLPEGWGRGLAYHATFGVTHVAYVAEVSVDQDSKVHVRRVIAAVDCGQAINPDNVAAQIEGGIAFGLTAALKAEATLKDGRIQQSNFHDYPILQMNEMPVVEVYIVPSDQRPSGIGEMGVPPIAPAVANAVFAATGKRVRHIPIRPEDLRA